MTQLGEAVAISTLLADLHMASSCPFCCKDEAESRKQDLANDPGTLRTACKLGDALGTEEPLGNKMWTVVYTNPKTDKEEISQVRSNPHHLIPGNASLKGHPILEAITKDKGTITADIGYDVNGQANGIWLPTILEDFYARRGSPDQPSGGVRWGKLSRDYPNEQFTMAEAAMHEASRQFHDAHPDYSEEVKARLDKFLVALKHKKLVCPEAGPKGKPDVPPPYGLVQRLNGLSRTLAGSLVGSPLRWKRPLYTSRHAIEFADKLRLAIKTRRGT